MILERPALERRVLTALDASPARIPVILGGCGSGRTTLLLRLHDLVGRTASQYIDLDGVVSTPEECLRAVLDASPFPTHSPASVLAEGTTPRGAFDALLAFMDGARTPAGGSATFLVDEVLEFRTFENFPGLRSVLHDVMAMLGRTGNRFVLATRYTTRALRFLKDGSAQFELIHQPPLTPVEIGAALIDARITDSARSEELARAVHALTEGRPAYVRALVATMSRERSLDPVAALAEEMSTGGRLAADCRYCYELRLHRARGYGALKAILNVLAGEEPMTLTEIALRLRRTPGSTKDYLSWLEDVDLVTARVKRYTFTDPVLRLWTRLHCRPMPPADEEVAREVQRYALNRLPEMQPALAAAGPGEPSSGTPWGIIEID